MAAATAAKPRKVGPRVILAHGFPLLLCLIAFLSRTPPAGARLRVVPPEVLEQWIEGRVQPVSSSTSSSALRAAASGSRASPITERNIRLPISLGPGKPPAPLPTNYTHSVGYWRVPGTQDASLFYWYFECRKGLRKDDPLVLWLTGGPGCSSAFALFMENGPYVISSNNSTILWNPHGWDQESNIIFLDQPVGTGLSYTSNSSDLPTTEAAVAQTVYQFLLAFLNKHPEHKDRPFFVTGESYAGHYIPPIANRILTGNQKKEGPTINLKGIAMGDPWTDPYTMYESYPDYLVANKLITAAKSTSLKSQFYSDCAPLLQACGLELDWYTCMQAAGSCSWFERSAFNSAGNFPQGINYYDVRKPCTYPPDCYDSSAIGKFLALGNIRLALGIPAAVSYVECSNAVYYALLTDLVQSMAPLVPPLLKGGISVLVYNGDKDLICDWMGNWRWVSRLQPASSFKAAKFKDAKGKAVGDIQYSGNLTFLKIYNAGHLVPMDQPTVGLDMLRRFTRNISLY